MLTDLLIVLLLVAANGVFAGAELAVLSIRRTRLAQLAEAGRASARAAQALRASPERFLATVQIGITVVGATASAFGGASLAEPAAEALRHLGVGEDAAEGLALSAVVAGVSYLSLVLGELVPKSLGIRFAEQYGLTVSRPLLGLAWLMRPLVWSLTASSNVILRLFGDRTTFTESRLSAEELQQLVEEAGKHGSVHRKSSEIASRAFDLAELRVSEVMVPRSDIIGLPRDVKPDALRAVLLERSHSRMPVYEGTIDHVAGYVVTKDLLALAWHQDAVVLEDAIRPALFFPETTPVVDALNTMQERQTQLSIVVDEQGQVSGLITVEDVMEELVGEILNEQERPPMLARRDPDGSFVVNASAPIRELNRLYDLDLPDGPGFSTVGGLVLSIAQAIPAKGSRVHADDGSELEVLDASPRRVRTVRIRVPLRRPEL